MVVANIAFLFVFKYLTFVLENVNLLLGDPLTIPQIGLPVGISFFTFKTISYCIDIKRGKAPVEKNFINMALYVSLFTQVLMGPIVRYSQIAEQIRDRKETPEKFVTGFCKFTVGFAKKVLFAGTLVTLADKAFNNVGSLSVAMAWLGMFAYSFQIYFDFSGYSDMAIGMSRMFGFEIPENFEYPYVSTSVAEYWRRWHISMGAFFKEYVFMPATFSNLLKKNPFTKKRLGKEAKIFWASFITWFCTGIWHGASWNFMIWGLYYLALTRGEEHFHHFKNKILDKTLWFLYATFAVKFGQVLFRAKDLPEAGRYFANMFGFGGNGFVDGTFLFYINEYKVHLILAALFCLPLWQFIKKWLRVPDKVEAVLYPIAIVAISVLSVAFLVKGGYNPSIYFNF